MSPWSLSGPRDYLERLRCAISDGCCVVAPFARVGSLLSTAAESIEQFLLQQGFDVAPVVDVSYLPDESPGHQLWDGLGFALDLDQRRTAGNLAVLMGPRRVAVVTGLTPSVWPAWRLFLADFYTAVQGIPAFDRPALILIVDGLAPSQAQTSHAVQRVIPFQNVISEVDALSYVVQQMEFTGVASTLPGRRKLLFAHTAAKLSQWDFNLARELVDCGERGLQTPGDALMRVADSYGWTAEALEASATPASVSWEEGKLDSLWGISAVHSAYAAMTNTDIVRQRVWSAQASLLLPLIDVLREKLFPRCARFIRFPVPTNLGPVDAIEDLEIGALAHFVRKHPQAESGLVAQLNCLADARNQLAHFNPIDFPHICALTEIEAALG